MLSKEFFPKKAFSLVEMLISLIVISCIVAAFAPLFTKKVSGSLKIKSVSEDKTGLSLFTNPGVYSFDIPINIKKIYISAAGGGGDGLNTNSLEIGKGGDGSDGYLRIRWGDI